MIEVDPNLHRILPSQKVDLSTIPSEFDGAGNKKDGRDALDAVHEDLQELQELLFATEKRALLVVLQAMDTGGKDSTIRHIFEPLNPQGIRVNGFKAPSQRELRHDYLWRVHRKTPQRGMIGVFNRSHYEDVLVVRVKNLVDESRWQKRYDHINHFEQLLADEGTAVLKFYLHISKDYQKQRLQRRLDKPDKHWKFNPADLKERARWDDYQHAYETVLENCSTEQCPWYVIPAETRWYRDLVIATAIRDTLRSFDLKYPEPTFDPKDITIE